MSKSISLIICLICVSIAGCAPKPLILVPDYTQRQPRSVAVLPVEDARWTKEQNSKLLCGLVEGMIEQALRNRGYSIIGVGQTRRTLWKENISDDAIQNAEPAKIASVLGVDALLKGRLDAMESKYAVIARGSRLEMDLFLLEGKQGEILWEQRVDREAAALGLISAALPPQWQDWIDNAFRSLPKATVKEVLEVDRQHHEEGKQKLAATISSVRLPEYEISLPPPNAPPEIKMLLGKWQGYWRENRSLEAVLVVQKVFVEENRTECIYAWGPRRDGKPGYNRMIAKLVPGSKPMFKFERKERKYEFTLKGKLLHGTMEYRDRVIKIVMEKAE
jgi:TolB-like protein